MPSASRDTRRPRRYSSARSRTLCRTSRNGPWWSDRHRRRCTELAAPHSWSLALCKPLGHRFDPDYRRWCSFRSAPDRTSCPCTVQRRLYQSHQCCPRPQPILNPPRCPRSCSPASPCSPNSSHRRKRPRRRGPLVRETPKAPTACHSSNSPWPLRDTRTVHSLHRVSGQSPLLQKIRQNPRDRTLYRDSGRATRKVRWTQ
jgi:hypothetical protein